MPYHLTFKPKNKLADLFKLTNKKQIDLARCLDVSPVAVNLWVKNKFNPSAKYIKEIKEFFGLERDSDLFYINDQE